MKLMKKLLRSGLIALLITNSVAIYANSIEKPKTNIILNTLMKSGSEHLVYALQRGLNYERMNIYSIYEVTRHTYYSNIKEFYAHNSTIAKQHLMAPSFNSHQQPPVITGYTLKKDRLAYRDWRELDTESLKQYTNKLVIHIRDPRPALLSFAHHIIANHDTTNKPDNYFDLNLNQQLDWCIDNVMPYLLNWINDWLAIKASEDIKENGLKILVTTYDELIEDELKLFNKILAFYDIPASKFHYQPIKKEQAPHFRKGDQEEWRQVLTAEQQNRINTMVSDDLLQRFNWKR